MKDPADKVTGELIDTPKKRGRPATGRALTPAERMRRMRAREAGQMRAAKEYGGVGALVAMNDAALLKLAGDCMRTGDVEMFGLVMNEMFHRTRRNRHGV
ncbi:hypothetical protein [Thauera sp. Sel9]|uniref:hypothetical protein n=1 Tax=Thauera sp. Sel9 TaxID=2974299 RepID=UPI0021E1422C|nr:hypothetical protein [Thauera sp. Sel9]MCV2216871.1 hypothetical protein [Thauera sp. Sel9]